MAFFLQWWQHLSALGTQYAHHDDFTRRRIVMANQIGIFGGVICGALVLLAMFISTVRVPPPTAFAIAYLAAVPLFNRLGWVNFSRISLSIVAPIAFLAGTLYAKLHVADANSVAYYFMPRFSIIGTLLCSATVLDIRNRWQMGLGMGVNACCLIFFDPIHQWLGLDIGQTDLVIRNYGMVTAMSTGAFLFLAFGYLFLQHLNAKSEERIMRLFEEMREANEDLRLSEEEIKQNAEELSSINDSLLSQNALITKQHATIELRNKQMLDSMTYARRVQKGFVSQPNMLKTYFPQSFVLDIPRDVVSGDFYWCTTVGDWQVLALCDCTGHGTAAALMTMVAHSLLVQACLTAQDFMPDELLYEIDAHLQQALLGQELYDGMDIALLGLHPDGTLRYAGAHSDLNYVENGRLHRLKGSAFTIGMALHGKEKVFEAHTLSNVSHAYLSSDGFKDQFDAHDERKLYGKDFRALLQRQCHLPMEVQFDQLCRYLQDWKGDNKQTDDILVIGVALREA